MTKPHNPEQNKREPMQPWNTEGHNPRFAAFNLKEANRMLGISYIAAFRLVQRGKLRSSSALRTKLIAKTELERFIRETTEAV